MLCLVRSPVQPASVSTSTTIPITRMRISRLSRLCYNRELTQTLRSGDLELDLAC
jgi:hypothetical protein